MMFPRIGQSPPSRRRRRFPNCSAALVISFATVVFQVEFASADSKIDAGQCSVAVAGSAVGNSITCNFGLTPGQLRQLTEAAVRGATDAQQEHVDKVSRTLGLTESAAKNLLKIVGDDANVPEDKLAEALTKAAEDYRRLQTQVAALNPGNQSAKALVDQAKSEIESGDFEQAHKLLREATQAQIAAAQEARRIRERAQAAEDTQWLGAASSTAAEGDVALTERKFDQAAGLFGQAAGYVSSDHKKERGDYLLRQADALYREGGERGDNNALREAIEVCRSALAQYPRSEAPIPWANAETDLGNVLQTLGQRESGTARLGDAVSAYRAALEELPRERFPIAWATTQNNLGAALLALGERESGTAQLEEAVNAYRSALEELTRQRVPLEWAETQNNLGNALQALGMRETGTERLKEAVAAHQAALEERTRERVPLDWAATENDLGAAIEALGDREGGTARLEEAVAVYRAALEVSTPDAAPYLHDLAQSNLDRCLSLLSSRRTGLHVQANGL
jgi:tetratricopeptide (TPR) repeat protein